MIEYRKGVEGDKKQIALCIAEAFAKDFALLSTNTLTVAQALENGIQAHRFYVALYNKTLVGALAVSDCNGRSVLTDAKAYKNSFGFLKGLIASFVLNYEFGKPFNYPDNVGYIEFVCVLNAYRRQGITTKLLNYAISNGAYSTYELDVTDVNHGAINCYTKFGFVEYKREKVSHAKQKGFNEKIYMRYEAKKIR